LGVLLVVSPLYGVHGARILGLFPIPSKSHFTVSSALVKELANRGHQVTVLSPFPEKSPTPNYTDIVIGRITRETFLEDSGTIIWLS
jgi:glucuronosyltransferase